MNKNIKNKNKKKRNEYFFVKLIINLFFFTYKKVKQKKYNIKLKKRILKNVNERKLKIRMNKIKK